MTLVAVRVAVKRGQGDVKLLHVRMLVPMITIVIFISLVEPLPAHASNCPTVDPVTREVTPKPTGAVNWSGCDVSHGSLANANLFEANLDGANLAGAYLFKANIGRAHLSGTDFTNAVLTEADLGGNDLRTTILVGASFRKTSFYRSDLSGLDLTKVSAYPSLLECNLSFANLENTNLSGMSLAQTNLTSTSFTGANMDSTDLLAATLEGIHSGGITGTPRRVPAPWDLRGGYFLGPSADLTNANLSTLNLTSLNLMSAVLTGAEIAGTDFTSADLRGVKSGGLTGAPLALPSGWRLANGYLAGIDADLIGADLSGADLSGADLSRAKVRGVNFSNAILTDANIDFLELGSSSLDGVISGGLRGWPVSLPPGWAIADGGFLVSVTGAPTNAAGTPANTSANLTWSAPGSNGGSAITSYKVTSSPGGQVCTVNVIPPAVAPATSCTATGLTNGTGYTFTIIATNLAGDSSPSSPTSTITPADVTPPSSAMTAPNGTFLLSNAIPVGWSASDVGSGVRDTDVFYQYVNAWGGAASSPIFPTAWQNTQQRSSFLRGARLGYTYCFQSRARDNSGNVSSWSPSKCSTIPFDERSLTRSSGWSRLSASGWLGNTATYTRTTGKYLTTSSSRQVRQVGVVALKCPTCGTLNVYVGAKFVGRISLYKSGASSRSLVLLPRFSSLKSGKVKLVVASSGKLVKVDALAATAS